MSILDFRYRVEVDVDIRSLSETATADPSFFNAIFFLAATIAAGCALADWALSKEQKRAVKEKVGDYWTRLQYESLDSIFRAAWRRSISNVLRLIGPHPWSLRRVFVPPILHLLLSYLVWWYFLRLLVASVGSDFGPIYKPGVRINSFETSMPVYVLFFCWLVVTSWVSWSGFAAVLTMNDWTIVGTLKSMIGFVATVVAILGITVLFACLFFEPAQIFAAVKRELHPLEAEGTAYINGVRNELVEAIFEGLVATISLLIQKMIWLILAISLLCWIVGPALFILILLVIGLTGSLLLRLSKPVAQPLTSLVVARLYESDRGVFSQLGVFIGATVKLIDEALKRFV